ncbi:hypothetical protein [Streptosporangium sp. NPDC051022]|uniref:hypothetical protein n=1 Tax=Streptosporangium sp. NPDC051022 TaxID=3155752 RepID=UPI0034415716
MDPELGAMTAATTRLDHDAARARLCLAGGGTQEEAEAIMRVPALREQQPRRKIKIHAQSDIHDRP